MRSPTPMPRSVKPLKRLAGSGRAPALFHGGVGCAPAFALAGVLAGATVIARAATAFTLAGVLAFTGMPFLLLRFNAVRELASYAYLRSGIRTGGSGHDAARSACEKTGKRGRKN